MNTLTIEQAAFILGVTRATIYNWINAGDVPNNPSQIVESKIKEMEERVATAKKNLEYCTLATPA